MRASFAACLLLAVGCTTSGTSSPAHSAENADASTFDAEIPDAGPAVMPPECPYEPPVDAGLLFADAGAPVVLASGQTKPWSVAVDDTSVYWLNASVSGGVYKVAKAGGTVTPLYTGAMGFVESFGVDATSVFFPDEGPPPLAESSIRAVPIAGGAPRTLASTAAPARGVAVANGEIHWVEPGLNAMFHIARRVAASGGPTTSIAVPISSQMSAAAFIGGASDGVYASLMAGGGIVRIPADGSQPSRLFAGLTWGLTVDAERVYFAMNGSIDTMPRVGGCPKHLAVAHEPLAVASDDLSVYFVDNNGRNGRILSVLKVGGPVTVLADGEFGAHAIAVDASHVYWTNIADGTIKSVAK